MLGVVECMPHDYLAALMSSRRVPAKVAWVLNLRGGDVECNPVFISYLVVAADAATLYVDSAKVRECATRCENVLPDMWAVPATTLYVDAVKMLPTAAQYEILRSFRRNAPPSQQDMG